MGWPGSMRAIKQLQTLNGCGLRDANTLNNCDSIVHFIMNHCRQQSLTSPSHVGIFKESVGSAVRRNDLACIRKASTGYAYLGGLVANAS